MTENSLSSLSQAVERKKSRMKVSVRGVVQGVGFRPFIYRLATQMGFNGWVKNSPEGVLIEVEGPPDQLDQFLKKIVTEKPGGCLIQELTSESRPPVHYKRFEIRSSEGASPVTVPILPDLATCPHCLEEIFDKANRRYLYPFTSCTDCGPRFSMIETLPYDRTGTSMKQFEMCPLCLKEYLSPGNRRFHAQSNACPDCGPRLEFRDQRGIPVSSGHTALLGAAKRIRAGDIVAVKGLGGFHLVADARNGETVLKLRQRKRRGEKPFALMVPSLDMIKLDCRVEKEEERLLTSPAAPIVLLRRRDPNHRNSSPESPQSVSPLVAPGNPYLGVMLPYTPLHHILLRELGFQVVATSGNLAEEPICIDEEEALERLSGVADYFLVYNRPIVHPIDDSVVAVMMGREMMIRRSRGYAPLPVSLPKSAGPVLAVGGHLKNTIAVASDQNVMISQHIGDLEGDRALKVFHRTIEAFQKFYGLASPLIVCDQHPGYSSTQYGVRSGAPLLRVQHHHAHILSCMAENGIKGAVLGVAWDGSGYGSDGTLWGGEFLLADERGFTRQGHLRPFRLPGGEKAIQEPRRSALGILYEIFGEKAFDLSFMATHESFTGKELTVLRQMLLRRIHSPLTSSMGRLFDGMASLIGLRHITGFEGQAAMDLEFSIKEMITGDHYPMRVVEEGSGKEKRIVVDWEPMVRNILEEIQIGIPAGMISAKFHHSLVEAIVTVARIVGNDRVVLTGGCFQNRILLEHAVTRLAGEGFCPVWHRFVPPNDGGISLGQMVAAVYQERGSA
jgi:hydrogenase maturation protein HypF